MIPVAAILTGLEIAKKFIDSPLVNRMLQNWSHKTLNKVDDWIIDLICTTPVEAIPDKLAEAQQTYDATAPATKAAMKAEPSQRPELAHPDVLAKVHDLMAGSNAD